MGITDRAAKTVQMSVEGLDGAVQVGIEVVGSDEVVHGSVFAYPRIPWSAITTWSENRMERERGRREKEREEVRTQLRATDRDGPGGGKRGNTPETLGHKRKKETKFNPTRGKKE